METPSDSIPINKPVFTTLQEVDPQAIDVAKEDPTNEYVAASTWEELKLPPQVLQGIYAAGFHRPSKIQATALPMIFNTPDKGFICQSKNGSGKTATFCIAMLSLFNPQLLQPQGLCIEPTRELALQTFHVLQQLGQFVQFRGFVAIAACPKYDRQEQAQILVGSPGKTCDLLQRRLLNASQLQTVVLDEADALIDLERGLATQVQHILTFAPPTCRKMLFSATFPDRVKKFATMTVGPSNRLTLEKEELNVAAIQQGYIPCSSKSKLDVIKDLFSVLLLGQSIIFVNHREDAFKLANSLKEHGLAVSLLCGSGGAGGSENKLLPEEREKVMEQFRTGVTKVLVATDVLSRGIDVQAVTCVVNVSLPQRSTRGGAGMEEPAPDFEVYLHRIGRTGRFGQRGIAITLVDSDVEMKQLKMIEEYFKCTIQQIQASVDELEKLVASLRS